MLGRVLSCLLAGGLLVGCASSIDSAKVLNPDPPDKMYARADALLNGGNYSEAARKFEDLDRDHPYSPEARRAIVMAAYAYYKAGKYPEAVASARRYTTLHPGTKDAHSATSSLASFGGCDPSRDQTATARRSPSSRRSCSAAQLQKAGGQSYSPSRDALARRDEHRPLLPAAQ
jgi:outer membrane protein assembly factor BamD